MTWTVPPIWKGETAYLIAGGPSVAKQNVAFLQGRKVIAINSSWQATPFAQFCFFGDRRWWAENEKALEAYKGQMVTCAPNAFGHRLRKIEKKSAPPAIWPEPNGVVMGRTSLQAAMNFAVHLGVCRIVLLGADMQADGNRTHHHSPHPWPQKLGCWDQQMKTLVQTVEPLKALGVEILNASPVSRLPWWPKVSLDECL